MVRGNSSVARDCPVSVGGYTATGLFSFQEVGVSVQEIRKRVREFRRTERMFFYRRDHPEKELTPQATAQWLSQLGEFMYGEMSAIMAATKAPAQRKSGPVEFKGFVNYVLSEEDKTAFKAWDVDDHDLWLLLATDIQIGYKLSVSYNKQNDTFSATYMCNDPGSQNAGYCLSAFAPDWYNAVKSLVFKHNEVLDTIWNTERATEQSKWG